jgi:L-malate glycosyltransferase
MRIAHVAPNSPANIHDDQNIQGDQRHVLYLAEAQRARGLDAAVLTDRNGLFAELCERDGIPVFVVNDLLQKKGVTSSTDGFAAKIEAIDADIVHYHSLPAANATMAAVGRLELPCIITLHSRLRPQVLRDLVAAKRAGLEFSILAVSKKDFELMQDADMSGIDFHYIPSGTKTPSGVSRQGRNESYAPSLILVGSLTEGKGIDLAILAMVELKRRRGADCPVLNIYGKGSKAEYYGEMARVLQLDDVVKFLGLQVDILDKCPSSDVLIVASRSETGPLVVLEAMSRGMPIVTTDVGDVNEMLPDLRHGRVVPVESITELANAIDNTLSDIASGKFDPDLLIKRHQSQYSIEKMADRIEGLYQSAWLAYHPSRQAGR